jgi:hypothetical protein
VEVDIQALRYRDFAQSWVFALRSLNRVLTGLMPDHGAMQSVKPSHMQSSDVGHVQTAATAALPSITKATTIGSPSTQSGAADTPTTHANVFGAKALFKKVALAKTLDTLPDDLVDFTRQMVWAVAVTLDNVFDEPGWRVTMKGIWSKLPLGLIVGSLRLINPLSVFL